MSTVAKTSVSLSLKSILSSLALSQGQVGSLVGNVAHRSDCGYTQGHQDLLQVHSRSSRVD